jgi:dTDP-4-amino-4,6-dideoxygalactose transaminase
MRIGRTLPPAAAPLRWTDLREGLAGLAAPDRALSRLEAGMREHFRVSDVFLLSSGKAALTLALMALKSMTNRTEVVIPAYTCFSVPAAVLRAGLRPRLCDVDPHTFDFDHAQLERTIGPSTLCVVAHHLFGIRSDIGRTLSLCRARGIFVVEDAAQAMGIEHHGRKLGTSGDVGVFSLGRGKTITCGSGGVIVTSSKPIAAAVARHYRPLPSGTLVDAVKDLIQFIVMTMFIRPRMYWFPAALPWLRLGETIFPKEITLRKLSGMRAGLLRHWRARLGEALRPRAEAAEFFDRRLDLQLPDGPSYPYLRVPIYVSTRTDKDTLYSVSRRAGLGLSVAYPTPISEIPELRATFTGEQFPAARRIADTLLTLPTHPWVSRRDRLAIAACVANAVVRGVPTAA